MNVLLLRINAVNMWLVQQLSLKRVIELKLKLHLKQHVLIPQNEKDVLKFKPEFPVDDKAERSKQCRGLDTTCARSCQSPTNQGPHAGHVNL